MNFEDYIVEQKNKINKDSTSSTKIIENKEDLENNKEDLERISKIMAYMENEKQKILEIRRKERELELLEKESLTKKGGNINDEELIKQKYLKYKIKYLKLKNS